ncbi:putative non-specific serine/threonine protein kinase [Lupinus albus]|uniref:Putative non-specific serine/threonine protein kinase n=1 Tax=Lupinus albus TaxID=3870 RepID=A0A6A4NGT5_LUPAL|nr:putative non-specific serine/threonine protein kinase [Lupinus albus]
MKCFAFYYGRKKDDQKILQSMSGRSEMNSLCISDTSSDSLRRNAFPSFSQRPSNLKIFTVLELKSATKNFSRSLMLGEGGFGCVYKGLINSVDDPSRKIVVAVKQLGKSGTQARRVCLLFSLLKVMPI